ncbi:hypothetical protein D6850_13110 [Roseovarius spongiae]|uniref:Haem-binding uptake Tiki superfamily ChaN domain-containing protein n=1 Tax=Roseovarius spongiae TaxID=2320272 RepID=A0A3A8ASG6_9RHOB|nr:ChaN family lipoprotein [Roseovarius spongiae]RKF14102.1 hypothetical protein D6850_13110 [Roseovarius spongiae]
MIRVLILCAVAALPRWAAAQDVWVLGESHDNPAHHAVQAAMVRDIAPAALVFEMLTPAQADGAVLPQFGDPSGLPRHLQWAGSGWPDFDYYRPIFVAAPKARVYGAGVPRDIARQAMQTGMAEAFGDDAAAYGLTTPLPAAEQAAREAAQAKAHCGALPAEMLPGMVAVQRLRDASLARAALDALRDTGGPVVVITGNGHARRDRGMPALLAQVAPDVGIYALGQGEDGAPPEGEFDAVRDAPAPAREDPCAAFH